MSKKRILSNGYTSDYRVDNPTLAPNRLLSKEEEKEQIRESIESEVFIFIGPKWMEAFDIAMKEEIKRRYG